MESSNFLPQWAPRVKQRLIRRLYENDAQGILDEALLDEVGWRLYERCQSFIQANAAVSGRAPCPVCGETIAHQAQPDEILHCATCGWEMPWKRYFQTIQHRQLSGAAEVIALFQDYVDRFPAARAPGQKMLLIDILIHGFHWSMLEQAHTRAAGINLIEGKYHQVIEFLDQLSYGPGSTPGAAQRWEEWRRKVHQTGERWDSPRLRRKGLE